MCSCVKIVRECECVERDAVAFLSCSILFRYEIKLFINQSEYSCCQSWTGSRLETRPISSFPTTPRDGTQQTRSAGGWALDWSPWKQKMNMISSTSSLPTTTVIKQEVFKMLTLFYCSTVVTRAPLLCQKGHLACNHDKTKYTGPSLCYRRVGKSPD